MEKVRVSLDAEDLRMLYDAIEREILFLKAKNKIRKAEYTTKRIKYLTKLKAKIDAKQEQLERFFAEAKPEKPK